MRHELADLKALYQATGDLPACRDCGGIVKTATISFGQAMPQEPMARAESESLACDLFLVLGSSLVVVPAAGFPQLARRNGAKLVIVNREHTDQDPTADLVLHDEIGPVMSSVVRRRTGAAPAALRLHVHAASRRGVTHDEISRHGAGALKLQRDLHVGSGLQRAFQANQHQVIAVGRELDGCRTGHSDAAGDRPHPHHAARGRHVVRSSDAAGGPESVMPPVSRSEVKPWLTIVA